MGEEAYTSSPMTYALKKHATLLCIAGFAAFSVCDVLRKILAERFEIAEILFWSAFFSLGLILIAHRQLGGIPQTFRTRQIKLHAFRALLMTANSALAIYGLNHLPLFDFYTLFFVAPFVTMILAFLIWKEKIERVGLMAALAGFSGVLVAFHPDLEVMNWGIAAVLAATVTMSLISLTVKSMGAQETKLSYLFYPMTFMIIAIYIYQKGQIKIPDIYEAVILFFTGFSYVFGWMALKQAFATVSASLLAPWQYTQLLWGTAFGYFIFGNVPDGYRIAGAAIIVLSGLYLFAKQRQKLPQ